MDYMVDHQLYLSPGWMCVEVFCWVFCVCLGFGFFVCFFLEGGEGVFFAGGYNCKGKKEQKITKAFKLDRKGKVNIKVVVSQLWSLRDALASSP